MTFLKSHTTNNFVLEFEYAMVQIHVVRRLHMMLSLTYKCQDGGKLFVLFSPANVFVS